MGVVVNGKALSKPAPPEKFTRLLSMGQDRVMVMNNALAQGHSTVSVTRLIQEEWGLFTDVKEKTLMQQVNRYRLEHVPAIADNAKAITLNKGKLYERLDVLSASIELALLQKDRVVYFAEKEKEDKKGPSRAVNEEITTLQTLYDKVQKLQFDLGVDAYQGPLLSQGGKSTSTTVTMPGGMTFTQETREAYQAANAILDGAGVPREPVTINGKTYGSVAG